MTTEKCKQYIGFLWIGAFLLCLAVIAVQSGNNVYGKRLEEVWQWFLPTLLPTTSLVISVFVAGSLKPKPKGTKVNSFMFFLALTISLVYLLAVILTLGLSVFMRHPLNPLDLMKMSHFWLAPLQGMTSSTLGIFFLSKDASKHPPT
jgi:hypothetical protein